MNRAYASALRNMTDSRLELLTDQLKHFTFVDLGVIERERGEGRVDVLSYRILDGQRVYYKNIEMLNPGGIGGGFISDVGGAICLILFPQAYVPNTRKPENLAEAFAYTSRGAKAIPLTNGEGTKVSCGFLSDGTLQIGGKDWGINFAETGLEFLQPGTISIGINNEGTYDISLNKGKVRKQITKEGTVRELFFDSGNLPSRMTEWTTDGIFKVYIGGKEEPTAAELDDISTYQKWTYVETWDKTGKIEKILYKSQSDSEILTSVTLAETGDVTITTAADGALVVSLKHDDCAISVTNGKFTLNIDDAGEVTVETEGGVSLKPQKAVTIETQDAVTLKAQQKVEISGTSGVSVKGSAGTLEVT